jgi:voltage-gated potassium channel
MSPSSFEDLDRRARQRAITRSFVHIVVSTVVLVGLYAASPAAGRAGARAIIEFLVALLVFAGLLAWQVLRILDADHPELRAAEALAFAFPALIIVFAFTYLSLSHANPANFSEPLDHVSAIYFTVTVISTVGFGDIVARTDGARLLVTIQILLDLAVIVGIARTIVFAARMGVRRKQADRASEEREDQT